MTTIYTDYNRIPVRDTQKTSSVVSDKPQKPFQSILEEVEEKETSTLDQFHTQVNKLRIKVEHGDIKEPTYAIGASEFTQKEWKTFIQKFDESEEQVKEELKIRIQKLLEESEARNDELSKLQLQKLLEE